MCFDILTYFDDGNASILNTGKFLKVDNIFSWKKD